MYASTFGLQKDPFSITPDPTMVYMTASHREALAGLIYAVLGRKGFAVLTGEVGTGKTTLIARMFQHLPPGSVKISYLVTPTLTSDEFLELVLLNFGLRDIADSKAKRLRRLQNFLVETDASGQIPVVVIDEAHRLRAEVLEEIRLLGNFEKPDRKLLQIVLVGQTELGEMLNRQDLRQLKQRIAARLNITPMGPSDAAQYIAFRWSMAGGMAPNPFTPDAVTNVAHFSHGIPRLINLICDNSLMIAAAEERDCVGREHVLAACEDLDLLRKLPTSAKPPVETASSQPAQSPAVQGPMLVGTPFKTLQRYEERARRPSLLARCLGRIGRSQ